MKKKIGMVFPGQGAQFLGMGKELYDKNRVIQEYFETASGCLEQNFVRLCFAASDKELKETVNAQTAIFLLSVSIYELLKTKYGIQPDIVAGHSSGEYAAIFAAGGMTFADALYLLKKRATFMDEATHQALGGMVAVLGLGYPELEAICQKYDQADSMRHVAEIVNYNSPKQLVVSGTLDTLESVAADVRAQGGKVIPLNVAGAFHSRLMNHAAEKFALYMVKVDFKDLQTPLVNNIAAQVITSGEEVKASLAKQMSGAVQWWPGMQHFKDCDIIIEVGPGQIYSKILKREWPEKEVIAINEAADIERLLGMLGMTVEKADHEGECVPEVCVHEEVVVSVADATVLPEVELVAQESEQSLSND